MTFKIFALALVMGTSFFLTFPKKQRDYQPITVSDITICYTKKGCVFRTLFGEESADSAFIFHTPENVQSSMNKGLVWLAQAQQKNGGWGAGSHHRQNVMDPHAVNADPATTAMVAMALLRSGSTLKQGAYSRHLQNALDYLLYTVESTPEGRSKITEESNTQIQTKLGQNIDAILAMQFFSNILEDMRNNGPLRNRVKNCLDVCVSKVQQIQDHDGSFKGSGWAGVLQSSLANNALESARYQGAEVDEEVLQRSRDYQKSNYDAQSGHVNTDKGAGVVLYSVSGSVRASAMEARKAREAVRRAKRSGKIKKEQEISSETLMEIGFAEDEALKYATSYQVYESSKDLAQNDQVMVGFGNNGGEEFLSYLQTGESLIINGDESWKEWYKNTSGRLISIQNQDGSWNGHHCITSPVFCTATTLLTLAIHNDMEELVAMGAEGR